MKRLGHRLRRRLWIFAGVLFHPWLLRLSPETAHHVGMYFLRLRHLWRRRLPGPRFDVRQRPRLPWPVANPIGLAAGFDKDARTFLALAELGFGFLEVGTVTPAPQAGNAKPRLWRVPPRGLVNHMGFNGLGLDAFAAELSRAPARVRRAPLLANIGKNRATPADRALADYTAGFARLADLCDGFVVNLSSPNTPGLRDLQNEAFLTALAAHLPRGPVLLKLSLDLDPVALDAIADFVRTSAYAGLVVGNTSKSLAERRGFKDGGYSGPDLWPLCTERLPRARARLGEEKVLIGVGGIQNAMDVRRALNAGADAVEVYTGFVYGGPGWVDELARTFL